VKGDGAMSSLKQTALNPESVRETFESSEKYFKCAALEGYVLLNALSIDVAVGAALSSSLVAHVLRVSLPVSWYGILSGVVWVIYTFDHLLDARRSPENLVTYRHQLHSKYFFLLASLLALVSVSCIVLTVQWLPEKLALFGVGLSLFVVAYLGFAHLTNFLLRKRCLKELSVAILYTVGVCGGPLVSDVKVPNAFELLALTSFFLAALSNLYLISYFEVREDEIMGFVSTATTSHKPDLIQNIRKVAFLGVCAGFLVVATAPVTLMTEAIAFFIMTGILFATALWPEKLRVDSRYRIIVDSVFVLPPLLTFFAS
jgi:hypothetical protein